jgi:hypothetical protein
MNLPYKKIHVIINPAAGHNEPILNVLNDVFHPASVKWDISITHESGDATRLTKEAITKGGSGRRVRRRRHTNGSCQWTVRERHPQAILPEAATPWLTISPPLDLRKATELIVNSPKRRAVDLARIGEKFICCAPTPG